MVFTINFVSFDPKTLIFAGLFQVRKIVPGRRWELFKNENQGSDENWFWNSMLEDDEFWEVDDNYA